MHVLGGVPHLSSDRLGTAVALAPLASSKHHLLCLVVCLRERPRGANRSRKVSLFECGVSGRVQMYRTAIQKLVLGGANRIFAPNKNLKFEL